MRAFLVYLPYFIAISYSSNPSLSYWIAWFGSWAILLATFTGITAQKPKDLSFSEQIFRPFIFTQAYFVGYNCLTSIFYFAHLNGYIFLEKEGLDITFDDAQQIATCQQYYVLAHAALTHGLVILLPKYHTIIQKNKVVLDSDFLIKIIAGAIILSILMKFSGVLSALNGIFNTLISTAITLLLILSFKENKKKLLSVCMFIIQFALAVSSGMKGEIILIFLLFTFNLFPRYKIATIILVVGFFNIAGYIPILSENIRKQTWYDGQGTVWKALEITYEEITTEKTLDELETQKKKQWLLLTYRVTEVSAFITYLEHVSERRDFYGLEIINSAFMGLIPRGIRPDGKSIDETAMERAYLAGALDRFIGAGGTSAKPAAVADA